MIICSCNVLSDHAVRNAVTGGAGAPRTAGEIFRCSGHRPRCGRCVGTICRIVDEALETAEKLAAESHCQAA